MKARESSQFVVVTPARQTVALDSIKFKIADCREERDQAFALLQDAYAARGLTSEEAAKFRIIPHQLLETTDIFVAKVEDEVIFTASVARDGELGLPIECTYADVVARFRKMNVHLSEVCCLAGRHRSASIGFHLLQQLGGMLVPHARYHGVDVVLIAVHPRQQNFYSKYLDFKCVGGVRQYASVEGNPAVCCALNLEETGSSPVYQKITSRRVGTDELRGHPISLVEQARYHALAPQCFESHQSTIACAA